MATVTTLTTAAGTGHVSTHGRRQPYMVENYIDFAAAATAKGTALAAADIIQAITVPAGSVILSAGLELTVDVDGATNADCRLDLGVTGVDVDVFVDGFDPVAGVVGAYGVQPAAFAPVVVGAAADTIDLLIAAATTAPVSGKVRVWAVIIDVDGQPEPTIARN